MPTLGEIVEVADKSFRSGGQDHLNQAGSEDFRPHMLPESQLVQIAAKYKGMVGYEAGLGVVSILPGVEGYPNELFIFVEKDTPVEIQEVLVSDLEGIRPVVVEIPLVGIHD